MGIRLEDLESLAESVITAEIQQHFLSLDPKAVVLQHRGVLQTRAEGLGIDLDEADLDKVAMAIDTAEVGVESVVTT